MKLRIILFSLCTLLATGNSFAETPAEKGYRIMEAMHKENWFLLKKHVVQIL